MPGARRDPEKLLQKVQDAAAREGCGRLKVFFGASAGVGKTYAMLEEAVARRAEETDVVIGWVETHGRKETAALLEGLPTLPPRVLEYRGAVLRELDIDAALARHPGLLIVDELAHTNAPGSRHAKRWQDVQELLDAGIHVYTTLNVQHVESLNDVVAQITGIPVRETVPDHVLDDAEEIEVVDLPPDDLLRRFKEGKVYVPEQAERAVRGFFRRGNLLALRELALRRAAEHVDADMRDYRQEHAIERTWPVAERLLVAVGPNPASARLIRATRRTAAGLRAEWWAVYVETPNHVRLPQSDKDALAENMKLAERLGARTSVLSGEDVGAEILAFARERNVSKIVAGKPTHSRWRDRIYGSLVDEVARGSGEIDLHIISGDPGEGTPPLLVLPPPRSRPSGYVLAALVVLLCTGVSAGMFPYFALTNLVMVYLAGVTFVATRFGRGPSVLASCLSVATFDFFFVRPHLTFAVADSEYVVTFGVMLAVGLIISRLTSRVREQADQARQRERRTQIVYAMTRELASLSQPVDIAHAAARHVSEVFRGEAVVLPAEVEGHLTGYESFAADARERAVADWVLEHRQRAGKGTDTLPGADGLYVPLMGARHGVGVLGLRLPPDVGSVSTEQLDLVETLARQIAVSLERSYLAEQAERIQLDMERERLRNTLLSSVSHDLRTPLAAVTGAASSLLQDVSLPAEARRDLTETIYEESERLNRQVGNLLDMTRLQSGAVRLHKEWHSLEEIVGSSIRRTRRSLKDHVVRAEVPDDLPLVPVDAGLIEQMLVNLLENAAKYTPARSTITVAARTEGDVATVDVSDEGPGLEEAELDRLFDKFYRGGGGAAGRPGVGLGLAICQAIATAHGGRIWAENRVPGGAVFRFTLPLEGAPPPIVDENEYDDER